MKRDPLLRVLAPELARHRAALALGAVCMVGAGVAELLRPWPLKLAFDLFLAPHAGGAARLGPFAVLARWPEPVALAAVAAGFLLVSAVGGAFAYAQALLVSRAGQQSILSLRLRLFRHLERLTLSFHRRRSSGELLVHLIGDLNVLNDFVIAQSGALLGRLTFLVAMVAVMIWLDPMLTGAALVFVPLLFLALRHHIRVIREATRAQRRREGRIAAVAGETLQLIQEVQAFGAEARVADRLGREGAAHVEAGLRANRAEALLGRGVDLVSAAGTGLVLFLGVLRVRQGALSAGDLIVFLSYLRSLQRPLRDLAQSAQRFAKASACAQRVAQLLDTAPEVQDAQDAKPAPPLRGDIAFDQVSFEYGSGRPALVNVTFDVAAGERVAVVGATGAGKTTLLALVGRFFDPTRGTVRIDGVDVRAWTVGSLRGQLALVLQEAALFGATIRENLLYGRPDAHDGELWAALREAQVDDFVRAVPGGLDAMLGERGATLSGGQRQRLAVARALLRDAPILLLDEPSTGLDAATDRALRAALERLTRGRTTLVIAHQLDTVCHADRILVLQHGRLVGNGTHAELLASCRTYERLWGSRALEPSDVA